MEKEPGKRPGKCESCGLLTELKKKGFDAFITTVDLGQLYYRVQVGAYSVKANALAMQQKLKKAGYDAVIMQA